MNRNIGMDKKLLFSPDDADMLVEKIKWILNLSQNEKLEMLNSQYQLVVNEYNMEKMQNKYISIFSE